MTVAIKIGHPHHLPAHWKSGPERGADEDIVVKIPYLCLPRAGNVKEVIWMTVVVEVSCCRRERGRISKVVTDHVEIDSLRRCSGDVGRLACATKRILHVRMRLRASLAQPITEVAILILIEIDNVRNPAIDREIARACLTDISVAGR